MPEPHLYQLLADLVLIVHAAVVLFLAGGLVLIVLGNLLSKWPWVNTLWFRRLHVATIGVVVAEAWWGVVCPLTTLEMWLRERARSNTYSGSFVEHWLQAWLFWQAPPWVFTVAYALFGVAVLAAWWRFPPRQGSAA
jgi:hypothetical protein